MWLDIKRKKEGRRNKVIKKDIIETLLLAGGRGCVNQFSH
jgi:hypothetical protein